MAYPVTFDVEYPERLSRWQIFFKFWLFPIPHIIILSLFGIVYFITLVVAWFAILFTGRYPQGLFNLAVGFWRWAMRVNVYTYLMRDEYPPFSTSGSYPARLEVEYPERLSRGLIFVKWFLAIPHFIILYGYAILAQVVLFIAWFAILFTGRFPQTLFNVVVGYWRWTARTYAYVMLLTDQYP